MATAEELISQIAAGFPGGNISEMQIMGRKGRATVQTGSASIAEWDNPSLAEMFAYLRGLQLYIEALLSWRGKDGKYYTAEADRIFPDLLVPDDIFVRFAEIEAESSDGETWWAYRFGVVVSGPDPTQPDFHVAVRLKSDKRHATSDGAGE